MSVLPQPAEPSPRPLSSDIAKRRDGGPTLRVTGVLPGHSLHITSERVDQESDAERGSEQQLFTD